MFGRSDVGLLKGNTMSIVTTAPVAAGMPEPLQDGDLSSLKETSSPSFTDGVDAKKEGRARSRSRKGSGLFRSASDVNIHNFKPQLAKGQDSESGSSSTGIKRVFSEHHFQKSHSGDDRHGGNSSPSSAIDGVKKTLRRHSFKLKKQPKVIIPPANGELAQLPKAYVKNGRPVQDASNASAPLSLPTTPTSKKRSTWILGPSRSPSPSNRQLVERSELTTAPDGTKVPEKVAVKHNSNEEQDTTEEPAKSPMNQKQIPLVDGEKQLGSKSRRPLSAVFGRTKSLILENDKGVPPLPKSPSVDRLQLSAARSEDQLPDLPNPVSKEQMRSAGYETPRKKDELWSNFRTLDGDYQKFASKPGTLKSNVIRSSLLPFLRQYADHPSNMSLRAEDLDRRVNILNKWWTGLLEMLNGRNGQSVSGNDRPAVLEGLSSVMARPEWQLTVASVSGKLEKKGFSSLKNRSTTSLSSNMSDFLAESVIHNVRNTFTQNLLSQMAFVVDRMSQRNAPASVVAFCGKACAYAFFYCPGVAEILIRLWSLSSDALRRVLEEHGFHRTSNLLENSEAASQNFPHHLRSLCFTSLPKVMRALRNKPPSPLNNAYIPWNGPWVGRWSGRDSDLFFCFVKHYYVLACSMLPEHPTTEQRMAAPCSVFVQAQLLIVMDATIHRGIHGSHAEPVESPAVTFDDMLGADASALPLSPRTPNASRSMAENRLVMLLREFLSDSPTVKESARKSFAEMFSSLLKASTKRVSIYDHNACFTLCDLLEECISILSRYYRNPDDPGLFLDFDFWLKVLKEMGESNNTMTEVRLFAFIYRFWAFISRNEDRKRDLCLNWLLREDYALRQFAHWCPMVRTYYMRVLCWKILRFDGEATQADLDIYKAASIRLRTLWSHFLYYQREAAASNTLPLSTAPSNPAPGRRMLIIRDDSVPAPNGTFQAFDGGVVSPTSSQPSAYERYSSLDPINNMAPPDRMPKRDHSPSKKRWATLRSINPFSSPSPPTPPPPVSSSRAPLPTVHSHPVPGRPPALSANAVKAAASAGNTSSNTAGTPVYNHHPMHSFKFSLEWADRAVPPRERKLAPPRLPAPAQMHLQTNTPDPGLPEPMKPEGESSRASGKYVGRALAEWAGVLAEFQGFGERRISEGVKGWRGVESPSLGVEGFRIKG